MRTLPSCVICGDTRPPPDRPRGSTIKGGVLNTIEMAFLAYDPCLGCATHAFTGKPPLEVRVFDAAGELVQHIARL